MTSKIRIRLNNVEVEYEGEQSFLASELLPMIEKLLALAPRGVADPPNGNDLLKNGGAGLGKGAIGTLNTLAAKLKPSSGPDLIVASLYHLAKADGQETATRQQILDRMKTARGYYKASFSNNMSTYLEKLVKANRIREAASKTYSLATSTYDELEAKFAQT